MLVYVLHKLTDEGRIPRFPIYVDSPLATNLTEVYRNHEQNYDKETIGDFGHDHAPLAFRNLTYTSSVDESKALNGKKGSFMHGIAYLRAYRNEIWGERKQVSHNINVNALDNLTPAHVSAKPVQDQSQSNLVESDEGS